MTSDRSRSIRDWWPLFKGAAVAWVADYAPSMGAALSYYSVFSLAPLLLIVISIAGLVFGQDAVRGEVFNVGSGTSISVKELADMISPNQIFTEARKGDSEATLADIAKIQAALGWTPKITFEDGLKELKSLIK